MYSKVLVPLDGSPFAERVLAHVDHLLPRRDGELILLRVLETPQYVFAPEAIPTPEPLNLEGLHQEAQEYLDQMKGELRSRGIVTHTQIGDGDVASTICGVADAQDVDLIAMTTHGRSGVSRWAFGSIADRVLRSANQPIFLVRGSTETPAADKFCRILVPLDGSELAERALPAARRLAQKQDVEIMLIRAFGPLSDREYAALYASWSSVEDAYAHRQTAAERYLEGVQEDLKAAGLACTYLVEEGHPAEVILNVAGTEDCDVIVMSTHGRSGLARWVYGSVADKVLHHATCPLLLIRAMSN
jgi:nucleotide-binding universal stress UspA family protein